MTHVNWMQCQKEFPKRSKEQTKASKVQVKLEFQTSQGLGGMKVGSREATWDLNRLRGISATMMTVTMMVMMMKTKTTLAVRKECMKKSSSCSLGQITSSVTCAQCFQYILCDTFLGMWGNNRFCKTAMNSREKLKTFNLLFCERLEKVQPQSCVAIVRRALGTRRFHF